MDRETQQAVTELLREVKDLRRRLAAMEAKEHATMHTGVGDPVHAAPESTLYWDTGNDCLWVNSDGDVTWCLIGCCGGS